MKVSKTANVNNVTLLKRAGLMLFKTKSLSHKILTINLVACVIIPSLNEEGNISELLASIKKQKTNIPVFVVISDNGSKDRTVEIAKKLGANVVFQPLRGIGPARQRGLDVINSVPLINKTKVVLIQTDSDCLFANENYIQKVCESYNKKSIMVTVGPTRFPILLDGDDKLYLTGSKEFKSCFGTLSLSELFTQCKRDINLYLLNPPYRMLVGANTTYRLSVFDKFGIAYPKDKSWETVILSVILQQNIKSTQIKYLDEQEILTSNRAYANKNGMTTKNILSRIKKQKYIKPLKSKDSISPLKTLENLIKNIDKNTYNLDEDEKIKEIINDNSINIKPFQRIVPLLQAATMQVVPNKFVLIEKNKRKYINYTEKMAMKHLSIFDLLRRNLNYLGVSLIIDSGYAVEAVCGSNITRKHDDLDIILVKKDFRISDSFLGEKILNILNSCGKITWKQMPTKPNWIWINDVKGAIGKQINIHVISGVIKNNTIHIINKNGHRYKLNIQKYSFAIKGMIINLISPEINELVATKIRLIEPYGNSPRIKDKYDINRMIKIEAFKKRKVIKLLENFYVFKNLRDIQKATKYATNIYQKWVD